MHPCRHVQIVALAACAACGPGARDPLDSPPGATATAVAPQCGNQTDDDGDGWTDLTDSGCSDGDDDNEDGFNIAYECNDGLDNDADGLTDTVDPQCSESTGTESVPAIVLASGITMLPIESGTFGMGCTSEQEAYGTCGINEYPEHIVTLTHAFWMAETEVTQAQYKTVVGESPSYFGGCELCPVDQVSWHDAAAFTNALSAAEELQACYTCPAGECDPVAHLYACEGYRLPTEAEWEFAARCNERYTYAGSWFIDSVGWYVGNPPIDSQDGGAILVAWKEMNACGLYDMSGNVWEWTNDWYSSPYGGDAQVDPVGATTGIIRVRRGGSWNGAEDYCRVAFRSSNVPSNRSYNLGFRPVRSIP